jgi:type IV secretory pathway ATPase VirB11/archaellum biosynthesis ATPase/intein/homing endonuclease
LSEKEKAEEPDKSEKKRDSKKERESSGSQKPVTYSVNSQSKEAVVEQTPAPSNSEEIIARPAPGGIDIVKRFRFLKNVKIRYPFTGTAMPPSWEVLERYPVNTPFAYVVVAQSPQHARRYFMDEVSLTKTEAAIYSYLLDALEAELTVPREQVNPREYFANQARKILLKYSIRVPAASWSKIIYFAERDLVGFGVLDGMMRDPNIEDVSIDALGKPLFIYHKGYESLETNVVLSDEEQMDNLITRLSHMAGKHISTAFPIVQGTLPGRHRLVATFRREVSPLGSSATIRKFREDPLTIVDMLNFNLLDHRMAAYAWYMMQNRSTGIVVGTSVDYATPMIYRKGGRVGLADAGKLIDPYFQPGEEGRAYTSDVEVFCFDPKTYETKWSPIQYVFRHRHFGKMLRFRLQTGREVTVTRDHSIFVLRNGKVASVHANEIGLGDFVVSSKSIKDDAKQEMVVDLLKEFRGSGPGIFLYGVPEQVFSRVMGITPDECRDWKHAGRLPLEHAGLLSESEMQGVRLGYKGSRARLEPVIKVDEGLARFLGYYVAEGAVKSKEGLEYTVYFTLGPKDKRMADDIAELVASKFGATARVRKHGGSAFRVVAHSKILVELLKRWVGTGAGNKTVPEVLLNSPSPVRRAFLKAWAQGDMGVTTSRRLMNGVLYLLLMERSMGTSYLDRAEGPVVIEGRRVNAHDSYRLRFPRPEALSTSDEWKAERIIREPGFPVSEVPPRFRRMKYRHTPVFGNYSPGQRVTRRSVSLLRQRVSQLLQYSGTPLKNAKESAHDGFYRSNSKLYDRVEGKLRAGPALLEMDSKLAEFERLSQSELAFLKVVGIEETDSTSEFVYDVSVPGCENFLAGFGGVFCHNTGAGKTTLLNALLTLTRLNTKLVTIEEVQEINIPHLNWTSLVSRESYAATEARSGEVGLFDLVKAAMRMRPDILCVGEVRGEEAYVLFQAISSVTGDTPVLVRRGGTTELMPIGSFVDPYYPGDTERVPIPVDGAEVLTFDSSKRVVFKPIRYVLRHRADEIYSVRYPGGEVRATGSHSVFVVDDDGDIVEKPVDSLQRRDVLVSFLGTQAPSEKTVLDVEGALRSVEPDSVTTSRVVPVCPHCGEVGWKRGTYGGRQRYSCSSCKRTFFGDTPGQVHVEQVVAKDGMSLVAVGRSSGLPKKIEVTEHLARVLGIYLADGCVKRDGTVKSVVFCFGEPEKKMFESSVREFFSMYGAVPTVEDRGTYVLLEFNHTTIANLFESLCGRTLRDKKIPSFIWTSPPDVIDAFLDGWRADARRTVEGRTTSYSSARPDLVSGLSWLARLNGRASLISERGSRYRSVLVWKAGSTPRSDAVPAKPLLKLKELLESTAWWNLPKESNVLISKKRARKALQEILAMKRKAMSWEAAQLVSRIESFLNSTLIASPVISVRRGPFDGFVYDLSVPGTEAFFGGESPVALHNTGHGGLCVPSWEKVMVAVDDAPALMSIEELYASQADPSQAVRVDGQEIAPTKGRVLVPSYDIRSNGIAWERVKRLSRRRYEGKLLKFQVRGGNQATVTKDHPMLVLRDGKITRVPAAEVRMGELITCASEIPQQFAPASAEELDLIDEVQRLGMSDKVTVRFVKDLLYSQTKGKLASALGVRKRAIDDYRKKDYLPFSKYIALKDVDRNRRSLRFRKSPHEVPAVISVDRDLARLIGFYLAEGHADDARVDFSFNIKERDFISEVEDELARVFGQRASRRTNEQNHAVQVVVKDRLLSWIFRSVLGLGSKPEDKKVPRFVFASPPEFMKAVLDTYFLGDGSAFIGKDARTLVQATTASKELAQGVYYLTLMLGYQMNVGRDKRYNTWDLTVTGGENFRKFVENFEIGAKLRGFVFKGTPGVAERVPIEYALSSGYKQLLRTRQDEGNRFVSREVAERLGIKSPRGVFFAQVTSIVEEQYSGFVYDLYEVEGSHNFLHGFGVITSNCTLHSDDSNSAIQRLVSEPMNVPQAFLPFLDLSVVVRRISMPAPGGGFKAIRRIISIDEVEAYQNMFNAFRWDPSTDTFHAHFEKSPKLQKLSEASGISMDSIMTEIARRGLVLRWLQEKGVRNFKELSPVIEQYASEPESVFSLATSELESKGLSVEEILSKHGGGGQRP